MWVNKFRRYINSLYVSLVDFQPYWPRPAPGLIYHKVDLEAFLYRFMGENSIKTGRSDAFRKYSEANVKFYIFIATVKKSRISNLSEYRNFLDNGNWDHNFHTILHRLEKNRVMRIFLRYGHLRVNQNILNDHVKLFRSLSFFRAMRDMSNVIAIRRECAIRPHAVWPPDNPKDPMPT